MLALLKEYVAEDPCAAGDPRHAKACALIEKIEPKPPTLYTKCSDCGGEMSPRRHVTCDDCLPF